MSPDSRHIRMVAAALAAKLDSKPFVTIARIEATARLRTFSGETGTRLKNNLAKDLDHALQDVGIRCFPHFQGTTTGANIRLFRSDGQLARLLDLLEHPGPDTDVQLTRRLKLIERP